MRTLIYGFGNPGRQDDALGLHLVEFVEKWAQENHYTNIATETNYQLNIEDAERISGFDLVLFCDASLIDIDQALIEEVVPDLKVDFSMHAVTPSFVLGLCQTVFEKQPKVYQLHIKGYEWEFMQPITTNAENNLRKAEGMLIRFLSERIDALT
jgi:hydrogenase maturation protease